MSCSDSADVGHEGQEEEKEVGGHQDVVRRVAGWGAEGSLQGLCMACKGFPRIGFGSLLP